MRSPSRAGQGISATAALIAGALVGAHSAFADLIISPQDIAAQKAREASAAAAAAAASAAAAAKASAAASAAAAQRSAAAAQQTAVVMVAGLVVLVLILAGVYALARMRRASKTPAGGPDE